MKFQKYLDVLTLVANGYTAKEMEVEYEINARTVEAIIARFCKHYGCKNKTHLIAHLISVGIIQPNRIVAVKECDTTDAK